MLLWCILSLLLSLSSPIDGYKILGLFPHSGKSHYFVFEPLLLHLAERGHEMTVVSFFPPKKAPPNWTHVEMTSDFSYEEAVVDVSVFDVRTNYLLKKFGQISELSFLGPLAVDMCDIMTSLPEVKRMVANVEHFDLVLTEEFISECGVGVAHLLRAPVVEMQSHTLMPWTAYRFGLPSEPAYAPNLFTGLSPRMNFLERVENLIFNAVLRYSQRSIVLDVERSVIERNLNRTLPPLEEVAMESVALISNTHYMLHGVRPMLPSIIQGAGMHIKRTMDPLNEELTMFVNDSPHGVILFSMGSMINMATYPKHKLKYFLDAFAALKERVIWKGDNNLDVDLPKNVYPMKWIPQFELLHHPKVKGFVSHGGLLGTLEAMHAGVPVFFVPLYGDQEVNAAAAELNGLGVSVPYTELSKERVDKAVGVMLSQSLRESAAKLSAAWRDLPDPLDTVTSHVEHIIRHGGHRRRSEALNLMPHQLMLIDVVLFLSTLVLIAVYVAYRVLKFALNKLFRVKRKKD